ncbi:hypothetical protein, partial [Tessaracoccus massiliensis]|uniref:hypothetical protein n=1 Tax=Tessaracoccus massiliensis TaxID=1522311 RepID=UPI00058AF1E1
MTADQAKKLAALVATVRPGWALNAITNALWDVRTRPLHKVAAAALRAAANPDCHTPAGIAFTDRPWWQPEPPTHDEVPSWRDPHADVTPADPATIRA